MSIPEEMQALEGKKRTKGVIWRKLALDMLCERHIIGELHYTM
jgi:hypothetical protein